MPTYDYKCPRCNHTFERLVPLAERDQVDCAKCGKPAQRLLTGGNFLKNEGCYSNKNCSGGCGCGASCGH